MPTQPEHLPFDDDSFDAAMATVTVHQWGDVDQGLREMRRVSRGPVVVLPFDAPALKQFWLADYFPEVIAVEQARFPALDQVTGALARGSVEVRVDVVPVPCDCTDGFGEAYYARPEAFLHKAPTTGSASRPHTGTSRSSTPRRSENTASSSAPTPSTMGTQPVTGAAGGSANEPPSRKPSRRFAAMSERQAMKVLVSLGPQDAPAHPDGAWDLGPAGRVDPFAGCDPFEDECEHDREYGAWFVVGLLLGKLTMVAIL